ncbi:MAG TPA: hypothetical protein VFO55_08370 [Gemmatimonadaceae bacterium]|nr:hypothetical protein [Gemmatimonadaceae bacterium]
MLGPDGIPVADAAVGARFTMTSCAFGDYMEVPNRTSPPCTSRVGGTTADAVGSSWLELRWDRTAAFMMASGSHPIGSGDAVPTTGSTLTGTYSFMADSIIVELNGTTPSGASRMAFGGDVPARVPRIWLGPDSIALRLSSHPRLAIYTK